MRRGMLKYRARRSRISDPKWCYGGQTKKFRMGNSVIRTLRVALLGACVGMLIGPSASGAGRTQVPDFSGQWSHPFLTGFEPPASGPGPVRNKSRRPDGVANFGQLVGDYTNPILRPEAAQAVKQH